MNRGTNGVYVGMIVGDLLGYLVAYGASRHVVEFTKSEA